MSDDKKLSPENSPAIMGGKKRARRLNSRPLLFAIAIVVLLILTLGMVVVKRSGQEKGEIAMTGGKSAAAHAKSLTSEAGAGMIAAKGPEETLPLLPMVVEKPAAAPATPPVIVDDKPPPPAAMPRQPEKPKQSEEVRKLRDKRFRQIEAAIDGSIKVQLEDVQKGQRDKTGEITALERQIAALGNQDAQTYAERLVAVMAATEGGSGGVDYSQRGDLSRMNQFSNEGQNWLNPSMPEAPPTMHIIRTGAVIPATLISGINSDLPGQIVGQVAQDVYDTPTGKSLLIPQGSRLVGEYSSQVQYGQSRVFAVWQRLIFPDGKALDLGSMPGSSGAGYSGFRDRVNNHYVRIFGSAIMMSAILAGVEMTQDNNDRSDSNSQRMSDAMSEALGQQLGGVMAEMLQKNMNIAPTLEIRPGYRFNVMMVKDLVFHGPYQGFDYVQTGR